MAAHNDTGKEGEELAAKWLTENGFSILHRNWRHRHLEIDIIANKEKFLHFIEVKARYHYPGSYPEESVTKKKFRHLKKAADEFLFRHPGHSWIQYDIISVTFHKYKEPEIYFLADVFYS